MMICVVTNANVMMYGNRHITLYLAQSTTLFTFVRYDDHTFWSSKTNITSKQPNSETDPIMACTCAVWNSPEKTSQVVMSVCFFCPPQRKYSMYVNLNFRVNYIIESAFKRRI